MSEGLLASGKEGAIERHSLVCAPLRPDLQDLALVRVRVRVRVRSVRVS